MAILGAASAEPDALG